MLEGNTKMDESQKYMEDLQKLVDTGEANEDTYEEIQDIENISSGRQDFIVRASKYDGNPETMFEW